MSRVTSGFAMRFHPILHRWKAHLGVDYGAETGTPVRTVGDGVVDFAGNEKSMAFAVSTVARGGKVVVSGLMGGNFSLPMVQWVYKRMTIEGFMVGTLAEAKELMALARAGKIKPTPMKEEPMADVQKWIDELRAGKVVGRIVLKN